MRDDCPIDIVFKLNRNIILRIALFEIAKVRYAMKQGKVIDDCIEIKVVIFSIARNVDLPHLY